MLGGVEEGEKCGVSSAAVKLIRRGLACKNLKMINYNFLSVLASCDTAKGAHWMNGRDSDSGFDLGQACEMKCHRCGQELPLLHPHIVVEWYDDADNVICDSCFMDGNGDPVT